MVTDNMKTQEDITDINELRKYYANLISKLQRRTENTILLADAYKETHFLQYPKNVRVIESYLESRGGVYDETVFAGQQIILKKYFEGVVVEPWMLDEADEFLGDVFFTHEYFNRQGWERILNVHGGKLPLKIRAVREGSVVGVSNVLVIVESTDPELPWLTNWAETILHQVWYPITVSTISYQIKKEIAKYANISSDTGVSPFHLNSFGFRGVSSVESAGIGEVGHLIHFKGTDTLEGIVYARRYYGATTGIGHSVAAYEHSTVTIRGKDHEFDVYKDSIDIYPEGILSMVSDSYNIWNAIKYFGTELKDAILNRGKKTGFAKFVVRPDSGDPVETSIRVIRELDKYFGHTLNSKGFKVLNPKVGVIYGDGICHETIKYILDVVTNNGYSTDCIIFGMGGALLQASTRDTQRFAYKCSAALLDDGTWVDVYKDPVDDRGKMSKRGRLELIKDENCKYQTILKSELGNRESQLVTVFENGVMLKEYTFDEVRKNAEL